MLHIKSKRAMRNRGFSNQVQGVLRGMTSKDLKYHMLEKDKDFNASSKMEGSALKNGHPDAPSEAMRHGFGLQRDKCKSFFDKKIPQSCVNYGGGKGKTVELLRKINGVDDYAPHDVPEGYTVVYVGAERRRIVIYLKTLHHPAIQMLLGKSAEEFGFEQKGGLAVPCQVVLFEHLLCCIETDDSALISSMKIDEVLDFYACSDY